MGVESPNSLRSVDSRISKHVRYNAYPIEAITVLTEDVDADKDLKPRP